MFQSLAPVVPKLMINATATKVQILFYNNALFSKKQYKLQQLSDLYIMLTRKIVCKDGICYKILNRETKMVVIEGN